MPMRIGLENENEREANSKVESRGALLLDSGDAFVHCILFAVNVGAGRFLGKLSFQRFTDA